MALKLLHIITDEKFPDAAYEQFEETLPGASTYLLPGKNKPIVYLKKIKPTRVSNFSFLNPFFIQALSNYDAIILHSMTPFNLELIARANSKVVFVWIGLGYDYYDLIYPNPYDMLDEETAKIVKNSMPSFGTSKSSNFFKNILRSLIYTNQKNKIDIIQKIKIFCPVLYEEGKLVEEKIGNLSPKIVPWNYGSHLSLFNNIKLNQLTGNNILIGNSASPTNNHFDIFKKISRLNLSKKTKIIVPLSYGTPEYRNLVIEMGYKLFNNQFEPITEFMDFNSYVKLIKTCSVIIMNHKRQQGAGNVGIGLYLGAKVFLNPESPLYKNYINQGTIIFSTRELDKILSEEISTISPENIQINRNLFELNRGKEAHLLKTRNLIKEIKFLVSNS